MAIAKPPPKSYLLGGDGFHKVFWPSLFAAFCITHGTFAGWGPMAAVYGLWRQFYEFLLDSLMRGAHRMMWWSVFGLLSSSCCAIQLILNLFNFGCAGFNTYLGPLRPVFLAWTITLNVRMWELAMPNIGLPTTPEYYLPSIIFSTIVAVFLSLLPEITELRNRSASSSGLTAPSAGTSMEVILSLEGLGCVACVSAVKGAMEKNTSGKVLASAVALEEKKARVSIVGDEKEVRDSIVPDLITRIEDAGFEATLQSMHKMETVAADSTADATSGPLSAIVAGLLSSSCCLLQLGVNFLAMFDIVHIGCAGFNKVLGPWRPHIRAVTFVWLSYLWFKNWRSKECCKGGRRRLLLNTVLCLTLTFLPEILRLSGGAAIAPPTDGAKLLKLKIDGMGCEACEAHVRSVMGRSSGVISSRADFKAGFAEVEVAENWGFDISTVLNKLSNDGYEAKLAE